jgi:hypothetical protein
MLKDLPNLNDRITLSAGFRVDDIDNPKLQTHKGKHIGSADSISNLGINVKYGGKINTTIFWIRFETEYAQSLFRGDMDDAISDEVNNNMLSRIAALAPAHSGSKISRFWAVQEFPPQEYLAQKYFNLLMNNRSIVELGCDYPNLFQLTVNAREFWNGSTYAIRRGVATPFIRNTNRDMSHIGTTQPEILNYQHGYLGHWHFASSITNQDIFNSEYETFLVKQGWQSGGYYFTKETSYNGKSPSEIWENDKTIYPISIGQWYYTCESMQSSFESELYHNFMKKKEFLFSEVPWYANLWSSTELWRGINSTELYLDFYRGQRPKTGEEMRLLSSFPIIMGAKGLCSYRGTAAMEAELAILKNGDIGLASIIPTLDHAALNDDESILDQEDLIGGDFLAPADPSGMQIYLDNSAIEWNTLGYEDTDLRRFYIGRRSARWEMTKLNRWLAVPEVNDVLVNLKLVAWHAKGFTCWDVQDPNITTPNIINNFIDIDNIKTRKIWDPATQSSITTPETSDKQFYDLTLLRNSTDNISNSEIFYIGIQNRRSDPLILLDQDDRGSSDGIKFISSAEFDDLCKSTSGGNIPGTSINKSQSWWQDQYWKRFGCREITIPMNYKIPGNPDQYCLLKVEELGGDLYNIDPACSTETDRHTKWFWRAPEYHDYVNKVINQDGEIKVKLLPGEGKILKVTVIKECQGHDISGYLDYSNQNKFTVFPDSAEPLNKVRFHLVYHKPDTSNNNLLTVYYVRSNAVNKTDSNNYGLICWEDPIPISKNTVRWLDGIYDEDLSQMPCSHPSIVLKNVGSSVFAYVSYECWGNNQTICGLPCDTCYGYQNPIVATKLNVTSTPSFVSQNILIDNRTGVEANWGTPVIHSAYDGFYVAWSDSTCGIGVAFEPYDWFNNPLVNHNRSYYKATYSPNFLISSSIKALHPSLSPYSQDTEQNFPLVWEQRNLQGGTNINYTMISHDLNNKPYNIFFPYDLSSRILAKSSTDANIVKIAGRSTDQFAGIEYGSPVVQREYKLVTVPDYDETHILNDVICYSSNSLALVYYAGIQMTNIYNEMYYDYDYNLTTKSHISPLHSIYLMPQYKDIHLTIAQGRSFDSDVNNHQLNAVNYNNILDFNYGNSVFEYPVSSILVSNTIPYTQTFQNFNILRYKSEGFFPHLAAFNSGTSFSNGEIWKNRVLYQEPIPVGVTPQIMQNGRNYLKTGLDNYDPQSFFGYKSSDFKCNIDLPKVDGNYLPINLPYTHDSTMGYVKYKHIKSDTIYSEWFPVGQFALLEFKTEYHSDTSKHRFEVQRLSDSSYQFLFMPLPLGYSVYRGILNYILINGNNDMYRFCFINKDTASDYNEVIYMSGFDVMDTVYWKGTGGGKQNRDILVDLGGGKPSALAENKMQIVAYPNPASKEVFVRAMLPLSSFESGEKVQIKLKLFSQIGAQFYEQIVDPGQLITIPVSDYEQGVYFIHAEQVINNFYEKLPKPAVEAIIINK